MGEPSHREQPPETSLAPVSWLVSEWRGLGRGELAFLLIAAVAVVAFAFVGPGGVANGFGAALVIGVVAGAGISLKRKRHASRATGQERSG